MANTPQYDTDRHRAYPEPPAHPLWHRYGQPKPRLPQTLTPDQQQRNRELLEAAARKPRTAKGR
ncbi:hypothetical protein ABZ820_22185 [Streptomyces diacarni]|uniref:hypothetical protein n=1 Tax=Streptomyces diacarni TaxID=2800381 RepID=UPI0033D16E76